MLMLISTTLMILESTFLLWMPGAKASGAGKGSFGGAVGGLWESSSPAVPCAMPGLSPFRLAGW